MSEENKLPVPKALKEGTFIFEGVQEGEGAGRRTIEFNPPLTIKYAIYEKTEDIPECIVEDIADEKNLTDSNGIIGYVSYDFGLTMATNVDEKNNLVNGYGGLTKDSDPIEILMYSVIFDLFHAFCHDISDPNYTHYHFALAGWLKDRAVVKNY